MIKTLNNFKRDLKKLANPKKAKILQRFFKTKKGEYGEGDIFLGVVVPLQRKLVKKYWQVLDLDGLDELLTSKIHEERLVALLILVKQYQTADAATRQKIYEFYLSHTNWINNWDMVDLSAPNIVGAYLYGCRGGYYPPVIKNDILIKLSKSKNLWERRIAILATFEFIKHGEPAETIKITKLLMWDSHDLIHKAVGWMLREVGKRCEQKILTDFLDKYHRRMPRTMLRYSIERLPKNLRIKYLNN